MTSPARFLSGSTMRHVVVMTTAGSIGLMFMFLVDFATLFWVGQAGDEADIAAAGFGFTIQFFAISVGVGFMIAAVALISRALGEGERLKAQKMTSVAAVTNISVLTVVAVAIVLFRVPLLRAIGAEGDVLESAARYLAISMPSLPIMAIGLIGSAALRAEGDAFRAMMITLSPGLVVMVIDPFLVLGLGLGLDGAAIGIVISRVGYMTLAIYYVLRIHNLAVPIAWTDFVTMVRPYLLIAVPAILTQLSTPTGNAIVTVVVSDFGDSAVAGWSVVSRVSVVAFGGIFALSGAIGGIIGQNYGAGFMERVAATYRNAVLFCALYVICAWGALFAVTDLLIDAFKLSDQGADVLRAFTYVGAAGFAFTGMLFVANAAFNSLDRALWATVANWTRDGLVMYPACILGALWAAEAGVIYGQAIANVVVGLAAVAAGWIYVSNLGRRELTTA